MPQVLLRYFADEDGRIRVVPRAGAARLQHIRNTSVVAHANTLERDDGRHYGIEQALSTIEGHYPAIVGLLDKATRSDEEDALIRALVVTQAARDPFTRSGLIATEVQNIYDAIEHALREDRPNISETEMRAELDFYGRHSVVLPNVDPSPENAAIAGTAFLIGKMYDDLKDYGISVLRSHRMDIITADSAATVFPRKVLDEALFNSETEFVLPVTPRHAVIVTEKRRAQLIEVSSDVVCIINSRTALDAAREIYSHPEQAIEKLQMYFSGWWASFPLQRLL